MPDFNSNSINKYRFFLWPLGFFYWLLIFWRNFFYNIGFFVSRKLPCKVVSVGNLSVGGTGKSPFVLHLANRLKASGLNVVVLSRGYKRKSTGTLIVSDGITMQADFHNSGDEPFMLAQKLSGIPVVVDEQRYRGGQVICKEFNPDIIVLDDAFQHRRIFRDVDFVLINSAHRHPKLLPYGLLREPLKNIRRAHCTIFTKTNLGPPSDTFVKMISRYCYLTIQSELLPENYLIDQNGSTISIPEIKGSVVAVSGVGDPESFEIIIEDAGLEFIHHFIHDDHADYSPLDLEAIREVYYSAEASAIITTEKDLPKLSTLGDLPLFALPVKMAFKPSDEKQLLELIV